jgi:hypothetical protein
LPTALHSLSVSLTEPFSAIMLFVAVLLMPVNWLLETLKLYVLLRMQAKISFRKCLQVVLAGLAFSLNTPNRIGEYLGRIAYLPKELRLTGAVFSLISGLSQLLITLIAGSLSLFIIKYIITIPVEPPPFFSFFISNTIIWIIFVVTVVLCVIYFYYDRALRWTLVNKFIYKLMPLLVFPHSISKKILLRILTISILRFCIFTTQYLLILYCLGVEVDCLTGALLICINYLIMAIIPTIAFAELGIRGKVALVVFGLFTSQLLQVTAATLIIWILNLIIPAIVGTFFLWNFKKYQEA